MLLKQATLDGIAAGNVDLAFRRWRRPTVKPGGELRTPIGVLAILDVRTIVDTDIRQTDAIRAGFESRERLLYELTKGEGDLYRIELRLAGPDPRIGLREAGSVSDEELDEIGKRLRKWDASGPVRPWTQRTLRWIADHPATPAAKLAAALGVEKPAIKVQVRKLKELGLTESLEVGYRLSPRGVAVLAFLENAN